MMIFKQIKKQLTLAIVIAGYGLTPAGASVTLPNAGIDSTQGVHQTAAGLIIDGSLVNFIDLNNQPVPLATPEDFRLQAQPKSELVTNTVWNYGAGTLCIGSGCAADLTSGDQLVATFDSMRLLNNSGGFYLLDADLLFVSGSLITAGAQGRMESLLSTISGDINGVFSGSLTGRVGAVNLPAVPLPAAAWLFIGGLGLVMKKRTVLEKLRPASI